MRRFTCRCGQQVYYENHSCANCQRKLGFDPVSLAMRAEPEPGAGLPFCSERTAHSHCNWLTERPGPCLSCRMSKVVPSLSKSANHARIRKLETAKRRLLYDLLRIGLPVDTSRLQFVFKEDRRTNPDVYDDHVTTGHSAGVITINAAEADEVYREQMRQAMNEPVRTLLGHFRHESGHYYFGNVVDDHNRAVVRDLFGDETMDYQASVNRYYADGPRANWEQDFISAYASAHPSEDWAETWAHYLHIRAVLDVGESTGLAAGINRNDWRREFIELVVKVNELLRSLGQPDAYPFVITDRIAAKLELVHRVVVNAALRG